MISEEDFERHYLVEQARLDEVPATIREAIDAAVLASREVGVTRHELLESLSKAVTRGAIQLPRGDELLRTYLSKKIDSALASGRRSVEYRMQGRVIHSVTRYRDDANEIRAVHARFLTLNVAMRSLDLQRDNLAASQQAYEDSVAVVRYAEMRANGDMAAFLFDFKDEDGEQAEGVAA